MERQGKGRERGGAGRRKTKDQPEGLGDGDDLSDERETARAPRLVLSARVSGRQMSRRRLGQLFLWQHHNESAYSGGRYVGVLAASLTAGCLLLAAHLSLSL